MFKLLHRRYTTRYIGEPKRTPTQNEEGTPKKKTREPTAKLLTRKKCDIESDFELSQYTQNGRSVEPNLFLAIFASFRAEPSLLVCRVLYLVYYVCKCTWML